MENRDWGRPHPVDLLPLVGLTYRLYWVVIARRGSRRGGDEWRPAVRAEVERCLFATIATAAVGVFLLGGADREATKPALIAALVGLMLHRFAAAVGVVGARAP